MEGEQAKDQGEPAIWRRFLEFLDMASRTVFGHDVFISYRKSEAQDYALALKTALEHRGYSCFVDVHELRWASSCRLSCDGP